MLDIKDIRKDKEKYIERLKLRHGDFPIQKLLEDDEKRRTIIAQVEEKKAIVNKTSKEIPALKKEGKDITGIMEDMKKLSSEIKEMDLKLKDLEEDIKQTLLCIPNIPNEKVKDGVDDTENEEIKVVGNPREFSFTPKAHWDLAEELDIIDFKRGAKIAGSRFVLFKGDGAKLERAIINFMLDFHGKQGYEEVMPPILVNKDSATTTGQLPKFKEDMFYVESKDMYLIPTAEVPVTNIFRDEIIDFKDLPKKYTAYTPCFRSEAGSAGRDTRGIIRNHQFDKVELVKFVEPKHSYEELDKLVEEASSILDALKLPYRIVRLCSGDLGFSSAMTYDIEVYMPSYQRYVEISSCSNFEGYQARRGNIRFKDEDSQVKTVHTLNGSGLAVGRTFAAILENYQNEDGSITIPEVLVKYLNIEKIRKK